MSHPSRNNIGAFGKQLACGLVHATAAGTGDNTAVTGATIDRKGYDSLQLGMAWKTSLTASETLAIAAEIQDSADGSSWNTAVALYAATTVATGALTNSVGAKRTNVDLTGYDRYVRINFTPNLSASGTDVAVVAATAFLGGAQNPPVDIS